MRGGQKQKCGRPTQRILRELAGYNRATGNL
jgi:hypothetical protein